MNWASYIALMAVGFFATFTFISEKVAAMFVSFFIGISALNIALAYVLAPAFFKEHELFFGRITGSILGILVAVLVIYAIERFVLGKKRSMRDVLEQYALSFLLFILVTIANHYWF